jgi:hypothetical protein
MSGKQILVALYAAVALGIMGAASVAQASDSRDSEGGGYLVPGSMVGVNPAYHPELFGRVSTVDTGRNAYGFAPAPVHKHRAAHEQTESR